ncbi:MAG: hypothetical protein JXM72_10620 [Deltaproteobacteria bacterium]|nr:hypothetical protein [Deltaproteobacteria bacterium]
MPVIEKYSESADSKSSGAVSYRYYIAKGQIMNLAKIVCVCRIRCLSGVAWITKKHDLTDYILFKDSAMELHNSVSIVIEALTDSVIEIAGNIPE